MRLALGSLAFVCPCGPWPCGPLTPWTDGLQQGTQSKLAWRWTGYGSIEAAATLLSLVQQREMRPQKLRVWFTEINLSTISHPLAWGSENSLSWDFARSPSPWATDGKVELSPHTIKALRFTVTLVRKMPVVMSSSTWQVSELLLGLKLPPRTASNKNHYGWGNDLMSLLTISKVILWSGKCYRKSSKQLFMKQSLSAYQWENWHLSRGHGSKCQ